MDNELEKIEGFFKKVIYKSSNYMVSILDTSDGLITITGPYFEFDYNTKYTLVGSFVNHPKYGFQFSMESISKSLPSLKEEVIKYLSSSLFEKVGKVAAKRIYDALGPDCLNKLKENPNIIEDVNISNVQKESIIKTFKETNDDVSDALFKLISYGLSSKEAHLILNHFKEDTVNFLNDNPYRFYLEVYGVSFNKIVNLSNAIDFDDKSNKYLQAYLIYIFKEISFRSGNLYLTYDDLFNVYSSKYDNFEYIIDLTIKNNYLVLNDNKYYLKQDYFDEKYIAEYLINYNDDSFKVLEDRVNVELSDLAYKESINYDLYQEKAIKNFFLNNFSLIVGGPGTGKTTIIKALVELFNNFFPYNSIIVLAPTGRAAKRINEVCAVESKTIHSLLQWNKDDNTFGHNENNPLSYDCIIIDEFSMVDNSLFAALLKSSKNVKKMCLIGDDNQLPSIRQGNLLYDLIHSSKFNVVRLNSIHRQRKGNEIIELSRDIVDEKVDLDNFNADIEFIGIKNFNKDDLVDMINSNLSSGYSFSDIQVLSPMYRGEFGIDALNLALQSSFNKPSKNKVEKRISNTLYREKDKILQLKNRPDDDVYNGDIGILEEIDLKERSFLINYGGTYIYYSFDDLIDISLAYAMSVHKAQGSEYSIVYFICSKSHSIMLSNKLIYTAISRAKEKLVIIGDKETFYKSILKDEKLRNSTLIKYLK